MHKLQKMLPYLVFPLLMTGGIGLTYALIGQGLSEMAAFSIVSLGFFLLVFLLEKVIPHRPEWNLSDGQEMHDLGHTFFGTALGAGAGEALTQLIFVSLGLWAAGQIGHGLWPEHWPFWLQVVLVYLLADLGRYLQHRLLHRYAWLWRFHALHHSVDRICALKTSRSHVVERLFQPLFLFGLLFFLGAPAPVIFCYMLPNSLLGMIDHSNLDVRLGPFSYVINGPAEHRLHHSRDSREGNSNFGSALLIWDMLFGTYINPRPHHSPQQVGIENDTTPRGFWAQIAEPFGWQARSLSLGSASAETLTDRLAD